MTNNETFLGDSLLDDTKTVEEKDLLIPILLILAQADRAKLPYVTTFQLHTALKDVFNLSEEDKKIVRRNNVTRFMRTLQNVFSHDLLSRDKLIEREENGWKITPEGRAHLLDYMLDPKDPLPDGEMRVLDNRTRVLEGVVSFYMLVRLAELQKDNTKPVSTTQLRKDIKSSLPLSVQDLAQLKGRSDSKIDQVVRNVVSHNTLTKNGYATRNEKGFVITVKGKAHVLDHLLEVFPSPDFGFLLSAEQEFRAKVNARRAEVAAEAAANRKRKQTP